MQIIKRVSVTYRCMWERPRRSTLSKRQNGLQRVIVYASWSVSHTERNYPAHKLEFLALKWVVTDRFHKYLYGGKFDVFTDNNPLTYILTSAKLDACGQRWVASLANYCKVLLLAFRWSLFVLCVVVVSYFLCNCTRCLYFSGYALMYISCNFGECCESVP